MIIQRSGLKELKLGTIEPEEGWELYVPPSGIQLGPLNMPQVILDPASKYRHPSRSLMKEFNRHQLSFLHQPLTRANYELSLRTGAMADKELLECRATYLKYRVPTDTSPVQLRRL